jgi:hypothetical protein
MTLGVVVIASGARIGLGQVRPSGKLALGVVPKTGLSPGGMVVGPLGSLVRVHRGACPFILFPWSLSAWM